MNAAQVGFIWGFVIGAAVLITVLNHTGAFDREVSGLDRKIIWHECATMRGV